MMREVERHARATAAFDSAVRLPVGEREEFVSKRCLDDPVVAEMVLEWLAYDEGEGLIDSPRLAKDLRARVDQVEADVDAVPTVIDDFRILDVIGHGGSSIVYRAEQQSLRREVAVKVLRPEPAGENVHRRFALEVAILASLDHPNVAKIYGSGTYESPFGVRPFLAMEMVHGRNIVEHCRYAELDVDSRVALLADVCDAVHHAHQHAVIHRDIKPGNVLVTDDGCVKVVDFGVARSFDPSEHSLTLDGTGPVGTLGYMSPEQVNSSWGSVDLRTDVYSLGVLAYRLLNGQMPCEAPSKAEPLSADGDPSGVDAGPGSLGPDLDAIVAKAMAADKRERYGSALDFADDFRAQRAGRPVAARSWTRRERLVGFLRDHPVACAVAWVVASALIFLVLFQAYVLDERSSENKRLARARAALQELFTTHGNDLTVERWMVASSFTRQIKSDPELLAQHYLLASRALGSLATEQAHRDRGLWYRQEAQRLFSQALGPADVATLEYSCGLAELMLGRRLVVEAERLLQSLRSDVENSSANGLKCRVALIEARIARVRGTPGRAQEILDAAVQGVAADQSGELLAPLYVMRERADIAPASEGVSRFQACDDAWAARALTRKGPGMRSRRRLRHTQHLELARLRVAVASNRLADIDAVLLALQEGADERRELLGEFGHFALWGEYAVMRALAAKGDFEALLEVSRWQADRVVGRYDAADMVTVLIQIMYGHALRETGAVDEARAIAEKLRADVAGVVADDRELEAHVELYAAECRASGLEGSARTEVLEKAYHEFAPRLAPDDERASRLIRPR